MHVVDVNELSARNRALRVRRIKHLRESVADSCYHVNPDKIASGMIREACLDAVSRRAANDR